MERRRHALFPGALSMAVLSNRQRKLTRKANRQAEAAMPKAQPVAAVVVQPAEPKADVIGAAFLREEAAAKAAVAEAEAEARAKGEKLTGADRKAIRAEFGVTKMADPSAPAAYRLRSRDGLTSARDTGVLTAAQHKAGMAYRLCFEALASGLKSGLANAGMVGGGSSSPIGLAARNPAALQRAYVMARLKGMEARLNERELVVVRAVAGEGQTVRSLGGGGNTRAANVAALVSGLGKIEGGLRIRGQ